jgi:hypothetical protein
LPRASTPCEDVNNYLLRDHPLTLSPVVQEDHVLDEHRTRTRKKDSSTIGDGYIALENAVDDLN